MMKVSRLLLLLAPCILLGALLLQSTSIAQTTGQISSISLQRTACFGVCPIYTVTLYPDGQVEFNGERFVESVGPQSARIEPEGFNRLVAFAERIGFFSLDDEYRYQLGPDGSLIAVSDLPSRITTIARGDQSKSVLNYFGGPDELETFENLIDEIAGTSRWIGEVRPGFCHFFPTRAKWALPTVRIARRVSACTRIA